jgi:hypothetical protein
LSLIKGLILAFFSHTFASIQLPSGLTQQEQLKALEILGPGTRPKTLANTYPLGGYSGFEIGITYQGINTTDLNGMGTVTQPQDFFSFPSIVIGKGIYHDVDVFLITMPYFNDIGISQYGANLRWAFYHGQQLPTLFTLAVTANSTNLNNQIIVQNVGFELIASIYVPRFTIYWGVAPTRITGFALGTVNGTGVGLSQQTELSSLSLSPLFLGASLKYEDFFWTVQIDGSNHPAYTTRLGFRL